jgi:hypothetical protein
MIALVLALLVGGLVSNIALAFECNNPNLNDHAIVAIFDVATGTSTPTKPNPGSEDHVHGAWVKVVLPWGDSYNIFVQKTLPDGALNAGPGEDPCDGKGIDDLDGCLAMVGP